MDSLVTRKLRDLDDFLLEDSHPSVVEEIKRAHDLRDKREAASLSAPGGPYAKKKSKTVETKKSSKKTVSSALWPERHAKAFDKQGQRRSLWRFVK